MHNKSHLYVVILAGGTGTRFWPVSRKLKPKQFINVTGDGTLFEKTLRRIWPKVASNNIFIVTNKFYALEVRKEIAPFKIPSQNILLEPSGKNTAPAICWVASKVYAKDKEAVLIVLPSDHLILNEKKFLSSLDEAISLAKEDYLVTLGVVPNRPETGYGYLKTKSVKANGKSIVRVEQFVEKPTLKKAQQFLRTRRYLWNSGMFIWKSSVILDEFKKYLPDIYKLLGANPSATQISKHWRSVRKISIDYGILEKSKKVVTVPVKDIGWSDLGSWESLADTMVKDKEENAFKGRVISLDCHNTFFWSHEKLIAAIGLKDLIIIDTKDALLICRKERSQQVKEIVAHLEENKSPTI